MIIISDNSALSAFADAGYMDILPILFGEVVIPKSVRRECGHARAPKALREWIAQNPVWIRVCDDPVPLLVETEGLDPGEASAISLAWNNRDNSQLIIDEKRGRKVAEALGLQITGAIGIMGIAAKKGLVDFDDAVIRLKKTGFHISDAVIIAVRSQIG